MVGGDDYQGAVVQADILQPLDELTEKAVDEPGLQQVPLILLRHGPGLVRPASCRPNFAGSVAKVPFCLPPGSMWCG